MLTYLEKIKDNLLFIEQHEGGDFIAAVFSYLFLAGNIDDEQEIIEVLKNEFNPQTKEKIMTIAEKLRSEGRRAGKLEGKMEGIVEGKTEIALKLLQKGINLEDVVELTELPIKEVQKLKVKISTSAMSS